MLYWLHHNAKFTGVRITFKLLLSRVSNDLYPVSLVDSRYVPSNIRAIRD